MVHQDVQIYPGDVRFNLNLGHPIPDVELTSAAESAHAMRAIDRLGGLDGAIRHRGGNVSVGEAQLLSFARTLAHDPPFIILDEATASVDTLTEAAIQKATEHILASKTVLVIAHRLSTVINADRIVVLDGGQILEQGSHAELLELKGAYAALFHAQFDDEEAA
jgi:ATP-binding cassette subfamily B protein